jgi:four helix bundle protein
MTSMKNPKRQNPNPREAPGSNGQTSSVKYINNGLDPAADSALTLNEDSAGNSKHPFDLQERTARFGEAIVRFAKKIPCSPSNNRLIDQLVGAGTSVGANYCEADERVSKKDFRNTIGRCKKEAKESMHFLRMIAAAEPELATEARVLYREAKELMLIFASIYRK